MGHFINQEWIEGNGVPFSSIDPSTGEEIWSGKEATDEEIDAAFDAANLAFFDWSSLSLDARFQLLKKFEKILENEKAHLSKTLSLDTGKPLWESKQEIESMIRKVDISYRAYLERCPEKKRDGKTSIQTHHRPHGVVGVLGPFNFPGHLPSGHIVPALLAGNCVVFKSSELTPLCSEEIFKCWQQVDLPKGVLNLIQGGVEVGKKLASHPLLDGLFFTGSFKAGKELLETTGTRPEKILALEMGGNNPIVVAEIEDMEASAYLTIQSAYLTSGQRCSCARRLIVMEGKESEEFLKVLSQMIETLRIGRFDTQPEPFIGPVISKKSMEACLASQAILGSQGGIPLVEMRAIKEHTAFLSPGLMDVTEVLHREDEEIFGPFLQVIRVKDFESALKEANHTRYGLAASLLSKNPEFFTRFKQTVKAGIINWNHQTTEASSESPFGGIKKSGNHRPSGYYAADYCSYPVASLINEEILLPKQLPPGIQFLAKT